MSQSSPDPQTLDDRRLFRQLADGQIGDSEFRALEERLAVELELRAEFVRFMDFEAGLYEEASTRSVAAPACGRPEPAPRRRRMRRFKVLAISAAASLLVAGLWLTNAHYRTQSPTRYLEAQLRGLEVAAVVTHVEGIVPAPNGAPITVGARLRPGILELRQGEVQMDFICGARVLLKAPAEFHVLSSTSATLVAGSAAARVTQGVGKFVLGAPDAAIVDLGTEFAVNVDDAGDSQIHVSDGEVEVSLLGDDGSTLFSQRLIERETVAIDRATRRMRPVEVPMAAFARVRELDRSTLDVPDAYVQKVLKSRPALYWRFAAAGGSSVQNEVDSQYIGRIVAAPGQEQSLTFVDNVAHFTTSDAPRYLVADAPLAGVNSASFTIELWLKSETFHWGTIVSMFVPGSEGAEKHLTIVELANHTQMVHQPCVVRFLHRHPPGSHSWGWNLFSKDTCMPGNWTHVVAVKEPDELRLYVDGVLVRSIQGAETAGSDKDAYSFIVGQMSTGTVSRQFQGMIDEMAVYRRALSEDEVNEHYWTMWSGNGRTKPSGPRQQVADTGAASPRT